MFYNLPMLVLCLDVAFGLKYSDPAHWSTDANFLCHDSSKYSCPLDGYDGVYNENYTRIDSPPQDYKCTQEKQKQCPKDCKSMNSFMYGIKHRSYLKPTAVSENNVEREIYWKKVACVLVLVTTICLVLSYRHGIQIKLDKCCRRVYFIEKLQEEITGLEGGNVILWCRLSGATRKVTWTRCDQQGNNNEEISISSNYTMENNKDVHRLCIKNLVLNHAARYTIDVNGVKCSSNLIVQAVNKRMLDDRGMKLTYDLDKNNGTGNMSDGESFDSIAYGETNKLNEWVTKYMRCKNNHLRCVIIGKTGTGKSATLNSISGQDLFVSKRQAKAMTQTCQTETVQQFSRTLTLVDTPGMFDSERPIDETQKEIARCIELTLPGPHLVFFTMRMDSRFSADDRDTVKAYIKQFGIEIMKHTIILLTHYKSGDDTNAFVTDVQNLLPYLKTHDKFMPFDNMLVGDTAAEQLKNLENIINSTLQKNNGRYYTNEQYEARTRVICEEIHKEEERKQKEIEKEFQRVRDQEKEKVQKESNEKIRKYLRYTTTGVKIAADVALPGSGIVIEGSQLIYCLAKRDTAGIKEHAFGAVLSGFFLLGGGLLAKEATAVYNAKVFATPVTEAGKIATKTFTEEFVGQAVKRIISPLGGVTKAVFNTFNTDDRQKDSNTHPHM